MDNFTSIVNTLANKRESIHQNHESSRPLSSDYEKIGISGEFAFGEFCGLMPDTKARPGGDGGVDFTLPLLFTVDVKTAQKASYLIHEVGKAVADIYVLAEYSEEGITLVGWEWGNILAKAPTKDFGYGVINHYIPRYNLRPMSDLKCRLLKIGGNNAKG